MNREEIIRKLEEVKRGRYYSLTKKKDLGDNIQKITVMRIRLGVNYSNMSINRDRQTGSLKYGNWIEGLEGLALEYTNKKNEYHNYLRVTTTDPNNIENYVDVVETRYLMNGRNVDREIVRNIVGDKKLESKPSIVYNIDFENILEIR